jgi:hypothetical protein
LNHFVELMKKPGTVAFPKGRWPTRDLAHGPKFRQQIPRRHSLTDVIVRERLPGWTNYAGALLQASTREGDVSSDHDVVHSHVFDDPIIGRVEATFYDFQGNRSLVRNSHPGVRYQGDIEVIAARHPVYLLFDRARIGVNEYV